MMWVLIKMQLIINRQPKWGDQVAIETWEADRKAVCATRLRGELSVRRENDLGHFILDGTGKTSGRPQRFHLKTDDFPWQPGREEMETNLEKVPELQSGKQIAHFRVQFSDLDVNRHVNSTRYLQWMIDSHSQEHLEKTELKAIELSFLAEALPNDEVAGAF